MITALVVIGGSTASGKSALALTLARELEAVIINADSQQLFADLPIADYAARAGLDEAQVRDAARRIAGARSVASFEDLGVQMNRHSTLVSYLHLLLMLLLNLFLLLKKQPLLPQQLMRKPLKKKSSN